MINRVFICALALTTFLVASLMTSSSLAQSPRKPNVILILADDLGYGELGSYGQTKIKTPHLDKMADQGMRFTQFYSSSPVCAPTRRTYSVPPVTANCIRLVRLPQPVKSADVNIDQRVTGEEWAAATQRWFYSLDTDRDGKLTLATLPRTPLQVQAERR